jgi:hypothetical protein
MRSRGQVSPDDSILQCMLSYQACDSVAGQEMGYEVGELCLSWLGHDLFLFECLRTLAELCLPETAVHSTSDSYKLLMRSLFRDLTISQYDDVVYRSAFPRIATAELTSIRYRSQPMSDENTSLCPINQGRIDIPHQFRFGIYVKRTCRLVEE